MKNKFNSQNKIALLGLGLETVLLFFLLKIPDQKFRYNNL